MSEVLTKDTKERTELENRFLEKFEVNEESGCWEWTAYTEPKGGMEYSNSEVQLS